MTKIPNPKQIPMTKSRDPNIEVAEKSRIGLGLSHWNLGFVWDLETWSLGFKKRQTRLLAAVITVSVSGIAPVAHASSSSLVWDPLSTPATGSDGSGTWTNASGTNWTNGTTDVVWSNATPNAATFGAGGSGSQTVTLGSNINATTLTFNNGASYTLTANSITLGTSGSGGSITVNQATTINSGLVASNGNFSVNVTRATGGDLTVTGPISGNFGFTKTGAGAFYLNTTNSFTGNINISSGTVVATEAQNSSQDGSLGGDTVSGRTITIGSGSTLLLTDATDANGSDIFGNGASGGTINYNGTYTPDPNMPAITINGGTLSSTRYNPLGNITLNGGTLTQASTDTANYHSQLEFYEGYQFIGSITVGGATPSTISATANSVDNTIGGDHLGPNTVFNVAKTSGAVDLTVSCPLLDQSDDFDIYNNSTFDTYIGFSPGKLTKTGAGTMSLTASNSYTGGTNVSGGTLIFGAPGALPIDSPLTIGTGATAMAAVHTGSTKNTLFASSLSITGTGKLDLSNNDLDVQNGNLAVLTSEVKQGFSNGTWNSDGGITSSAAMSNSTHLTALGVIQNSVTGTTSGTALYNRFDGNAVANTDVLIKYTYYGDTNLSGTVDGSDYSRIDSGYLSKATGWYNGDFNYDGVVNGSDYTLADNAFNSQGTSLAAIVAAPTAQIAGAASVPEPAMFGSIALGAMGLIGRRRNHIKF
jgi:fibronectin-binding autotransporter adhesin